MAYPDTLPEIAFYYPNRIWHDGDWIKNLILFFDGVGLLVPEYMKERPEQADAAIVVGLKQHGLLHIIEPERGVDRAATEKLAAAMTDAVRGRIPSCDRLKKAQLCPTVTSPRLLRAARSGRGRHP